ncbi:MAG: DUF3392 family protein [Deltaproteobacteria bacterium]|nr:DUF3392 family protein [Deltaproteobacteria bacterium]MBN2672903.1 DUF3392 family protein [Deltaproteobacteria bacterium]
MNFSEMLTLGYWNELAQSHLPELVMVLTAAIVVVLDRYIRRTVSKMTSSFNVVSRFMVFLLICSIGYAAMALGVAWALRAGITINGGLYAAPAVVAVLIVVAVEAQRQKQI